jgi:SAM-dependent methyltransferase
MPVFCNVLYKTREEALGAERACVRLVCCGRCGFIHNAAFEPERIRYGPHYGNPLSASAHFRQYATRVAEELIRKYGIYGREIVEVGCGDGYFLKLMCGLGRNQGIGFDPGYNPRGAAPDHDASGVRIVTDTYSRRSGRYHPAMVCCRHVLEHIDDPLGFLRELRETLDEQKGCIVFFEVPDARHTFLRGAIWDILYEHCNYFTSESLERVFKAAGFDVLQIDERYDGQYLTLEARPASIAEDDPVAAAAVSVGSLNRLAGFQAVFRDLVDSWQARMAVWQERRRRVVIWGVGTKGATFLNVLGLTHDKLEYAVDMHPAKQGKFVPGTGQEILAPEALAVHRPGTIVVMNPLYTPEIREMVCKYVQNVRLVAAVHPTHSSQVLLGGKRANATDVLNAPTR